MIDVISVVGLGKLGLCTAACLARGGYRVIGVDVRESHVAELEEGKTPFPETGLAELLHGVKERLSFTTDLGEAVRASGMAFIIVPTPSRPDGSFSNEFVLAVLSSMAPVLKDLRTRFVVNVVSTVMPGSGEGQFIPLLERETGKRVGQDIGYAYNPEFVAIGSVISDFLNPDLVLIGESDPETGEALRTVYDRVCDHRPHAARTGVLNAEIAKLALNCYCTMKISFANNLGALCDNLPHADAAAITAILGRDSRIGDKYIRPGLGFGGPCFPRDNQAFIRFMEQVHGNTGLQRAVLDINNSQVERVTARIREAAGRNGPRVALLGLSYKPHTNLVECSQALDVARNLAAHPELELTAYDPMARVSGDWRVCGSLDECVRHADVVAILTPWPEFLEGAWQQHLPETTVVLRFME